MFLQATGEKRSLFEAYKATEATTDERVRNETNGELTACS